MILITIENRYGMLVVHEYQQAKNSRLEWRGAGIEFYLLGSFAKEYDVAANLAANVCQEKHIPVASLRRVGVSKSPRRKSQTSKSIDMFSKGKK